MAEHIMEGGHLGQPVERIEDASLLSGRARFADHYPVRRETLHAAVLRSPYAHADIVSIDTAAALNGRGIWVRSQLRADQ